MACGKILGYGRYCDDITPCEQCRRITNLEKRIRYTKQLIKQNSNMVDIRLISHLLLTLDGDFSTLVEEKLQEED